MWVRGGFGGSAKIRSGGFQPPTFGVTDESPPLPAPRSLRSRDGGWKPPLRIKAPPGSRHGSFNRSSAAGTRRRSSPVTTP